MNTPRLHPDIDRVAVLGNGVCGVTTAAVLQERYPEAQVTIYSDSNPDIVTDAAGAQFYPIWLGDRLAVGPETLAKWFLASKQRFTRHMLGGLAIRPGRNYELFTEKTDPPAYFREVLSGFEATADEPLPPGFAYCYTFDTMIINPLRYVPQIRGAFEQNGGRIAHRRFDSLRDVAALEEDLVFNCLGLGSRTVFGDDGLEGVKGISLRLPPLPGLRHAVSADEFIVAPRGTKDTYEETYLGAPYRPGVAGMEATEQEIKEVLAGARRLVETPGTTFSIPPGSIRRQDVREVRAGFRPVRSTGPRVERTRLDDKVLIHNYGHGGNGVILSWGTAEHAVSLL